MKPEKRKAKDLIDKHGKTKALSICNKFILDTSKPFSKWLFWKAIKEEVRK